MKNQEEKIATVISYFLEHPTATNQEISDATGISKSSVQRYLSDPKIGNIQIPKTQLTISEQIKKNTLKGRQKGGRTTFQSFQVMRDESGHFIENKRDDRGLDKEEIKRKDIETIVVFFSKNPYATMDEIVNDLAGVSVDGAKPYTRDYIYRCLTDSRVEEIFGPVIASAISKQLDSNRYTILQKLGQYWNPESFDNAGLTKKEQAILTYRFSDEGIHSAEATAIYFGVSKSAVTKMENKAIEKLKKYQEGFGQK